MRSVVAAGHVTIDAVMQRVDAEQFGLVGLGERAHNHAGSR
jgi:hypothetical protein